MAMRSPRRVIGVVLLGVVLVVAANAMLGRLGMTWDLTAERSATLSEETRRVLDELDERIEITAFYSRDAIGRVEASTLLSRYRRANRDVSFRILDPTLAPGEAERLGVVLERSAAVASRERDRVEIAPLTIEIDVTSAIARLLREVSGTVCFATGHGERDPDDAGPAGLSQAASVLTDNGYRTMTVDLLARPEVPSGCDGLVVAAPTALPGEEAATAVVDHVEGGGSAFVLADPATEVDLSPLTSGWGLAFLGGTVVEGDAGSHLPGDLTAPIVSRYAEANPAVRGLGPTFFPGVGGVETIELDDPGLSATEVAFTSPLSYLDHTGVGSFEPEVDIPGPVAVGAAADASEVLDAGTERARVLRTRILVWGDVDFATNAFLRDAHNARLWIQAVDWLTQPEDLVTAVPNFPQVRNLELTEARSRYILMLTAGIVPGLFLIAGGFVWVLRRSR